MNTVVNIKLSVLQVNLALDVLKDERKRCTRLGSRLDIPASPGERREARQRAAELHTIIEIIES
jgi:hypothetical protein